MSGIQSPPFFLTIKTIGLLLGGAGLVGCSTLRVPNLAPELSQEQTMSTTHENVQVRARPIVGRYENWEIFDDNLPEIGLVAIWVELQNNRATPVDLTKMRWNLRRGNKQMKAIDVSEVLEHFYDKRKIRMYSQNSDNEARRKLHNVAFKGASLASSQKSDGFLFFKIKPIPDSAWNKDMLLQAKRIWLDKNRTVEFSLSLDNGNP